VQPTVATLHLQSQQLHIRVQKPTAHGTGTATGIVLFASGGSPSKVDFRLSMCRNCGRAADGNRTWVTSSYLWARVDEEHVSLDGLQLTWRVPPATDAIIDLDATASRFSLAKQYEFTLSIDCTNHSESRQSCVTDGDTVETVLQLSGPSSSTITITATIEAPGSCQWTRAWAEPALTRLPAQSSLRFHIRVNDVDNFPIERTRSNIELHSDGGFLSYAAPAIEGGTWEEQVVGAPSEIMYESGTHRFQIILKGGWNHSATDDNGTRADCMLLEHMIEIEETRTSNLPEDYQSRAIITGVAAGTAAVVAAFGCFCLCKCGHAKCLQSVIPGMGVSSRTVLFGVTCSFWDRLMSWPTRSSRRTSSPKNSVSA
jgi:hypothetical protein